MKTAFDLSYHTIYSIYKDFLTNGKDFQKKQEVFKRKKLDEGGIAFIHNQLKINATLTLLEIQKLIEFEVRVCTSTIDKNIKSFYFSLKRIQKISHSVTTPENLQQR